MDKIDSFVISAKAKYSFVEFTFVLVEEDIEEIYREHIIDYIDSFVRSLNTNYPEFSFTWQEAHRIKPKDISAEIIHQKLIQGY